MNQKKTDINLASKGEFLVYEAEDGRVKLDVRLQNETVWLSQVDMAQLFQLVKREA